MNALELFCYEDREVRTVLIDDAPWFVAADVCAVLEIGRVHDAIRGLDEDEKGADTIRTPGGDQQVSIINEPGLYSLVLRSRKPEAKAFKRWITHEVLPALRRTGMYQVGQQSAAVSRRELARMVIEAEDRAEAEATARTLAERERDQLAPAARTWRELASGSGDILLSDAAKVLSRDRAVSIGPRAIFAKLAALGWIFRRGAPGRAPWRAYQTVIDRGWMTERATFRTDEETGERVLCDPQVRVTAAGLEKLHALLMAQTHDQGALDLSTGA